MKHAKISLSGSINISYKGVVLIGELEYGLLNLLLTDTKLKTVYRVVNISYAQALAVLKKMNGAAPETVVEVVVLRGSKEFVVSPYGMRLMNAFAQKKFELSSFLEKSNTQLGMVFESGFQH